MKRIFSTILLAFIAINANAQRGVLDGIPQDSTIFTFSTTDSLIHKQGYVDTIASGIWKIGTTTKPYFSVSPISGFAIMTDTLKPYDTSINSNFKVVLNAYNFNTILSFRHKYQTRLGMDGGIVEYSIDTGKTWNNVLGSCNIDNSALWQGILTSNFYKKTDTLTTGEPAFSGISNGWQYSRVQVFIALPIKSTGTTNCVSSAVIQFRFRFYSDNQPDTLDGWMIDDLKIEHDHYNGGINRITSSFPVNVYPNPTNEELNIEMPEQYFDHVKLSNTIGTIILSDVLNETHKKLNIKELPSGIYVLTLESEYGRKTMLIHKE